MILPKWFGWFSKSIAAIYLQHICKENTISSAEWMLKSKWSYLLSHEFDTPEIDLFASMVNKQLDIYASSKPDPSNAIIGAQPISRSNKFVYIFPPFSMMWRMLWKECHGQALIIENFGGPLAHPFSSTEAEHKEKIWRCCQKYISFFNQRKVNPLDADGRTSLIF